MKLVRQTGAPATSVFGFAEREEASGLCFGDVRTT